jgi:GWxTD domain-containing protein
MLKRRATMFLLFALLAPISALFPDTRQDWNQPNHKWIRGPVRWIVTADEEKQFKNLKSDEEIAKFIKDFWARRDPTPDTPANEYEEFFWKRVEAADKNFVQTTDSGSMSDRGHVFILLGAPTKTGAGKNIEWIYENVPNITPPNFTILFRQAGTNPLLLARKEFEDLVTANEFVFGLGEKAKAIYAPPPVVAEALPSIQESAPPQEVATEESKLLDSLSGSDLLPTALRLQARTDIYEATKGDSYVVVTLGVARADAGTGNLVAFARFIPEAPDAKPVTLAAADSFAPAEAENAKADSSMFLYQGGSGLHPGRYTLLAGCRDPQSGKVGVLKEPLEIPKYEGANLSLSTVTLASSLEGPKTPPSVGEGKKPPFYLGSFRVVPSLDGIFKQGSDLAWYYQIYNAIPDPATGKPSLTIEYNFLLKQPSKDHPEGEFRPVTAPQIEHNRPSQIAAFSFQLIKPHPGKKDGWVDGEYMLTIKVTDEVAKSSVTSEKPFRVVP